MPKKKIKEKKANNDPQTITQKTGNRIMIMIMKALF